MSPYFRTSRKPMVIIITRILRLCGFACAGRYNKMYREKIYLPCTIVISAQVFPLFWNYSNNAVYEYYYNIIITGKSFVPAAAITGLQDIIYIILYFTSGRTIA